MHSLARYRRLDFAISIRESEDLVRDFGALIARGDEYMKVYRIGARDRFADCPESKIKARAPLVYFRRATSYSFVVRIEE